MHVSQVAPLIIVQARLGSKRLPGKVLKPIKGRPMLAYLLDRLPDENVVVATPDQQIAEVAMEECGVRSFVWNGPEDDVAGRFAACLEAYGNPSTFVRLCADSPLMDYALVEAALTLYSGHILQITSPVGCVQIMPTEWWQRSPCRDREHVVNVEADEIFVGRALRRFVVDTAEDFARVTAVIEKMDRPHWQFGWREVCALS